MDSTTIIRIVAGMLFVVLFLLYIFFILSLYRALSKCSVTSRTMEPGMVWLMLVPLVNLVLQFVVVIGLAKSLGNEFRSRGILNVEPKPGQSIGIAMCVCACCGIVPIVNLLALPAHLVLWIIYWAKISGYSQRLDMVPAAGGASAFVYQYPPSTIPPTPAGLGLNPNPVQASPVAAKRGVPVYVWIIVAFACIVPVLAIFMLIAIPTVGSLKKKANDLSAVKSVQAILQAEEMYDSTYRANGFACSLQSLGGDPVAGAPSPQAAQLIQNDLASGYRAGYVFSVSNCTRVTVNGKDRITEYQIRAVPQTVGKTGDRSFCADQFGTIKVDPAGGVNCTQPLN